MASNDRRSRILSEVLETAGDLHNAGLISKRRMHEFEVLGNLDVPPMAPAQIKALRESTGLSQAVFAAVLNTSVSSIQKWEIGAKTPGGPSLKLLSLIARRGIEAVI